MAKKTKFLLFFCSFLILASGLAGYSQTTPPANSWINYNQAYYKFRIIEDGVYRLNYNSLINSGIPINSIDPRNIQLFARGKEVPVYVEGESDGVFQTSDYIEFFGLKNDGWLDSAVYDTAQNIGNPYISLFNDTAYYFLTWNNSIFNLRMTVETDTVNFNQYQNEPFCFKESINVYKNSYYAGQTSSIATTDPEYSACEGWSSTNYSFSAGRTELMVNRNIYSGGPDAIFTAKVWGASQSLNYPNDQRVMVNMGNSSGPVLTDITFDGYQEINIQLSIPAGNLTSPLSSFYFQSINTGTGHLCYQTIPYSKLKFPHTFDFENLDQFVFFLPPNVTQLKSKIEFSNLGGTGNIVCYDLTNRRKLPVVNFGSGYRFLSPNLGNEKKLLVFRTSVVQFINQLSPVGNNGFFTDYQGSLNNADFLIVYHSSLQPSVQQYGAYKTQKGFNVLSADIDQLYDQYGYGVKKHPLAIRNFAQAAKTNYNGNAQQYLLLAGKAITPDMNRNNAQYFAETLVPTMGYPASDNLLTTKITGTTGYETGIPLGRIAAKNSAELNAYLQKLIQFENNSNELWTKKIINFAGGFDAPSQNQLKYYLQQYENTLEDTLFGGHVTTFSKTSTAPIQITASDSIKNLIESGVVMMNFFGHAAGSGFDQNIDDPSVYNWNGKYPLLVANSCFVGNLHLPLGTYISASENYTLSPNVGTIGFLAQVGAGLPPVLFTYTNSFFKKLGKEFYGAGIGKCMQEAVKEVQVNSYDLLKETCLEMTLHGDPSIKIYPKDLPDYRLTSANIYTSPAVLTSSIDSFYVNVIVDNIGRARKDSIVLETKRYLPDGSLSQTLVKAIKATYYQDTIRIKLPINPNQGAGINLMEFYIDATNKIFELSESNNKISVQFFIRSEDITPVYPYEFAIVPQNKITLKASTSNPLAPLKNYRFQIDTSDQFLNPLSNTSIASTGGVVEWEVPLNLIDSNVYYWRVAVDTLISGTYRWKESSFQYVPQKTGWAQAHFFQYKNNDYQFIQFNRPQRKFNFVPNSRLLNCRTYSSPINQFPSDAELYATEYRLDAEVQDYAGCQYIPAFHVAVIDSLTLQSWGKYWVDNSVSPPVTYNPTHNFGNANNGSLCRDQMEKYFIFRTNNAAQLSGMKNMLQNEIPNGNYILIYTWIRGNFQSLADTSLLSVLEGLGADSVRFLPNQKAWIFFAKKGDPSTAQEVISPGNGSSEITFSHPLTSNWNTGTISSSLIGPASSWNSLHWYQKSIETPSNDSVWVRLLGQRPNGIFDTLLQQIMPGTQYDLSLQGIADAQVHPKLKLEFITTDPVSFTPAQARKWQIHYEEIPESAVNPKKYFSLSKTLFEEGEPANLKCAIENISRVSMDSLMVKFWVEDKNRNVHLLPYSLQDSLRKGDTLIASISIPTLGYAGNNTLWMEVNPIKPGSNLFYQPEQYHFNNYLQVPIKVKEDITNPILDVTFDGIHIMNGDLISAKPHIVIKLNDENKYLLLNDTANFALYLKKPGTVQPERIYFGGTNPYNLSWIPAQLPHNTFTIEMKPEFLTDGKYELMADAMDASKNSSGALDYKIEFEVINASSITEVMNYPNPFSGKTNFVFTLTGSKLPDEFNIRIMTVSGKVVKEISMAELGPIRIGRNITSYAWDGTDEFGDPLATGVYLYKVSTGIEGESIEKRASGADEFFRKGWGKMMLIR